MAKNTTYERVHQTKGRGGKLREGFEFSKRGNGGSGTKKGGNPQQMESTRKKKKEKPGEKKQERNLPNYRRKRQEY